MKEAIWLKIPVKNLLRATIFYTELLKEVAKIEVSKNKKLAIIFDNVTKRNLGCLYDEKLFIPDMFGVIIYFELNSSLEEKLEKVKQLGGKRISLKKSSLIAGFEALIYDSEGNRIGIFSKKSK